MFLVRSQERPYLCEETNFVCSILLCHITLCLCFCISSVNWCTYVVLISLPPFDILIVYACTYVCILNAMLLLTLKVLNFLKYSYKWGGWTSDSYCSLKPLWSGMGEVVPARTSPTLHPPSPPTVLYLYCLKVSQCINCRD